MWWSPRMIFGQLINSHVDAWIISGILTSERDGKNLIDTKNITEKWKLRISLSEKAKTRVFSSEMQENISQ